WIWHVSRERRGLGRRAGGPARVSTRGRGGAGGRARWRLGGRGEIVGIRRWSRRIRGRPRGVRGAGRGPLGSPASPRRPRAAARGAARGPRLAEGRRADRHRQWKEIAMSMRGWAAVVSGLWASVVVIGLAPAILRAQMRVPAAAPAPAEPTASPAKF